MTSKRSFTKFPVGNTDLCKQQLLSWSSQFNSCCFLDNNSYQMPGTRFECLAGVGEYDAIRASAGNAFSLLSEFHALHGDWIFGHLGYDLKNELEGLGSGLPDYTTVPDLHFFVPLYLVMLTEGELVIGTLDGCETRIWNDIIHMSLPDFQADLSPLSPLPPPSARLTRSQYLESIHRLQDHILRGDCYEVTFCQEFYLENAVVDPLAVYKRLSALSPNPSSAYYSFDDHFLLCASPERYLQNRGGRLLSQPIKGTAPRRRDDPHKDMLEKESLYASAKERSENVMIVDLVRNDLSKVCAEGSVRVEELWGIYTFPQVFQMISSVTGMLDESRSWLDAIKATFPMGSMTGAPKRRVMELIEQYELTKRGIYSGAVGYIEPDGNFDFNVVIRSILYNRSSRYLSFSAGSAITAASDPVKEYDECLLKAGAIKKALDAEGFFYAM